MRRREAVAGVFLFSLTLFSISLQFAFAQGVQGLAAVVAPGELLPVAVSLTNIRDGGETEIVIIYQITNRSNEVVFVESEKVMVGKSEQHFKYLQLPSNLPVGRYTLSSTIMYQGQKISGGSKFSFLVDQKIAGFFVRQLVIYSVLGVIGLTFLGVTGGLIFQRRQKGEQ